MKQMGIDEFIEMPEGEFVPEYSVMEAQFKKINTLKDKIKNLEKQLQKEENKMTFKKFYEDAQNVGRNFLLQIGGPNINSFFEKYLIMDEMDSLQASKDCVYFATIDDKFPIFKFDGQEWKISNLELVLDPENKEAEYIYILCYEQIKDNEKELENFLDTLKDVHPSVYNKIINKQKEEER